MTSAVRPNAKTDRLRQAVAEAKDERKHLGALLQLARHFAEVSDGVNGLEAARSARALALRLKDREAVAQALTAASVSQYHRSEYTGALATAIDAWEDARHTGSAPAMADSLYTVALALHALHQTDVGLRIVDAGLALSKPSAELRGQHVRLVGLKALFYHRLGRHDETQALCAQAVELAKEVTPHLLELSYGNWGLALLRTAEQRLDGGQPPGDLLPRARLCFEEALRVATAEGDTLRVADRICGLGQVAFNEARHAEAEALLADSLARSLEADYVRTVVMSARYLAKLLLAKTEPEPQRAIEILRIADAKARRGAPVDGRPAVKHLLASALELVGSRREAERVRAEALDMQASNELYRRQAMAEARKAAARVLDEIGRETR